MIFRTIFQVFLTKFTQTCCEQITQVFIVNLNGVKTSLSGCGKENKRITVLGSSVLLPLLLQPAKYRITAFYAHVGMERKMRSA